MRTFPKALANFQDIVDERGQRLRSLPCEELKRFGNKPAEHLAVESRPATIGIIVQPLPSGGMGRLSGKVPLQGSMILAMIRSCVTALLLASAMSAQVSPAPTVRIVLPEGVHPEKVHVRYGLRRSSGTYSSRVPPMPAGGSSFDIPAPTDRFRALVWTPGCKIKEFNVPVEKSDIELHFACDPLKTVTLHGRVKSVDVVGSMTLRVDYSGMIACRWADATETERMRSCSGLDIASVATAEVAPDGSFKVELPDFNNDPIVSDSWRELDFWLTGIKGTPFLVPESSPTNTFKVAASYPAEVIFVPLD